MGQWNDREKGERLCFGFWKKGKIAGKYFKSRKLLCSLMFLQTTTWFLKSFPCSLNPSKQFGSGGAFPKPFDH